jgi:peptide-methionine (S)-S-oxide reductase
MRSVDRKSNGAVAAATFVAVVTAVVMAYSLVSPAGSLAFGEVTQEQSAPTPSGLERATFAAGCFWSMQAIFQELRGVESVYPGYAGGTIPHPSYELVETGSTGYAETVNITFDPKVISYSQLLNVLLTVRDPTTVDAQGPDVGNNYRSVIFYRSEQQKQEAYEEIRQITEQHVWQNPIVTQIVPFSTFWRAESYHLNYYNLHPNEDYCAVVIAPEIANFRSKFKTLLKS